MQVFGALPTSSDVCDVATFLWEGLLFRWCWYKYLYKLWRTEGWKPEKKDSGKGLDCQLNRKPLKLNYSSFPIELHLLITHLFTLKTGLYAVKHRAYSHIPTFNFMCTCINRFYRKCFQIPEIFIIFELQLKFLWKKLLKMYCTQEFYMTLYIIYKFI